MLWKCCECMCNVHLVFDAMVCGSLFEFVTTKMKIIFEQKYKQMRKFKINLTLVRSHADDSLIRNVNLFMYKIVNCSRNSIKILHRKNIIFWLYGKNVKLSSGIFLGNGTNIYVISPPFSKSRHVFEWERT